MGDLRVLERCLDYHNTVGGVKTVISQCNLGPSQKWRQEVYKLSLNDWSSLKLHRNNPCSAAILRNESNFYDLLFASVGDGALPKRGLLLMEKICSTSSKFFPLTVDSFKEMEATFKTSCLLLWVTKPFQNGVYSNWKEFTPQGANSFH